MNDIILNFEILNKIMLLKFRNQSLPFSYSSSYKWNDPGMYAESAACDLVKQFAPKWEHWADELNSKPSTFLTVNTSKVRKITLESHPIKTLNHVLRIAADNNDIEMFKKIILSDRLDPSYRIHLFANVLHIVSVRGYTEIATFLIEKDVLIDERHGNVKQFQHYRENIVDKYQEDLGPSPLLLATMFDNLEIAKILIENGADVNLQAHIRLSSDREFTHYSDIAPLHYAAVYGNVELITLLLDHGANIDIQNGFGESPLLFAAWKEKEDAFKLLLERGANHKLETKWNCPMHMVTENAHIKKLLVDRE